MAKRKSNNNKNLIIALAAIILLIVFLVVASIVSSRKEKAGEVKKETSQTAEDEEIQELNQEDEIKTLNESGRMKRYVGIFFDNIENGDYETSYKALNETFKEKYFPTLDDFKEYANKYFNSPVIGLTYDNIERLGNKKTGNMYVLWVTVGNIYQRKLEDDEEIKPTYFVIIERDYNNYEMSFSVNEE